MIHKLMLEVTNNGMRAKINEVVEKMNDIEAKLNRKETIPKLPRKSIINLTIGNHSHGHPFGILVNGGKDELVKYLKKYCQTYNIDIKKEPVVIISTSCNCTHIFDNYSDIPSKSLKCKCGKSWLIKYYVTQKKGKK